MMAMFLAAFFARTATTPTESTVPTSAPTTTTTAPTGDGGSNDGDGSGDGVIDGGVGGFGGGPDNSDGDGRLADQVPSGDLGDADNVVGDLWNNLSNNGYQTGVALILATVAVIIMRNLKVKNYILVPVTAGAFWAGWLLWNTLSGQENPLFGSSVSSVQIWDVAIGSEWGFFFAVAAACLAAIALWRSGQNNVVRAVLIAGVFFGASLVYNLVDSFDDDPLIEDEASAQQLMSP